MDEDELRVIIRTATPLDRNFVLATWLKGNYYGCPYFGQIPKEVYYSEYSDHILNILADPQTQIRIACDELDPAWIVGFAVFKISSLYWIHVKKDYRQRGIASLLLEGVDINIVKGTSKIGRALSEAYELIFDPF